MQVKTNSKNHPVFAYLLTTVSEEFEGTTAERLQQVCEAFNSEYNYPDNKKRYRNLQQRFAEWLMGLPNALNVEYRNHAILELAKQWGSIPQDATEKQEDKIIENWFNFAAIKFFQLCKFYKVDTLFLN
jgi:hypothetical protein